jgi:hypothetical protein
LNLDQLSFKDLFQNNNVDYNNYNFKELPPQVVIIIDAVLEVWRAIFQMVKNDKFFNPEEKVKKLILTEIFRSTIIEDSRVFPINNGIGPL